MVTPPQTIEMDIDLKFIVGDDDPVMPIRAGLRYYLDDPYAVHLHLYTARQDEPIHWAFARDLLAAGLVEPTGDGDVVVSPGRAGAWSTAITILLRSPDGACTLEAQRHVIARFLRRSYKLVARGYEYLHTDVDDWIAKLLTPRGDTPGLTSPSDTPM